MKQDYLNLLWSIAGVFCWTNYLPSSTRQTRRTQLDIFTMARVRFIYENRPILA